MRITCAILLLGNLSFTEDRTSDQAILVDDRGFISLLLIRSVLSIFV